MLNKFVPRPITSLIPAQKTTMRAIFNYVKRRLGYTQDEEMFKDVDEEMDTLLRSGQTVTVTWTNNKAETVNTKVGLTSGQIQFRDSNNLLKHICHQKHCWKQATANYKCREHDPTSTTTIWLKRDSQNKDVQSYVLVASKSHKPDFMMDFETSLGMETWCKAENRYIQQRKAKESKPIWISVMEWKVKGEDEARIFFQTLGFAVHLIFQIINTTEAEPQKKLMLIKERFTIDRIRWDLVRQLLQEMNISIGLEGKSQLPNPDQSPLIPCTGIRRLVTDKWVYMKVK